MPRDPDQFDFFVSYARKDNREGWITGFIEELLDAHRKFSGERQLVPFFDKEDICSLDDWQHRLYHGLAASRLFLAFISPSYFASEWCRREWRNWIDLEISKHILSSGVAPIYIVEVPGLLSGTDEQEVARQVAQLYELPTPQDAVLQDISPVVHQVSRRQINEVQPFYQAGVNALRQDNLRSVLEKLARDLDERVDAVRRAALSETTVPPYNRKFSGRLDELLDLRERLKDDRAGVISGIHGLGGVGKTELAFTFAHAFAGAYPGGRFLVHCEGKSSLREAALELGELFPDQISDEQRKSVDTYFAAIGACLRRRLDEKGHILLVLDNVTDPDLLTAQETDALTSLPMLHLLATTRLAATTGEHINWVTLGELPEADALALLEKHRPFDDVVEREAAQKVALRLGGFALAVELVGAWLAVHREVSYAGMLERLGLEGLEILDDLGQDSETVLRRHNEERRLAAVLGPTLATLSEPERRAIDFAACLAPDNVPLPWLREFVGRKFPDSVGPPTPGHPDPWKQLCRRLLQLALFSRTEGEGHDPQLVRIHRLVQDFVRTKLAPRTGSYVSSVMLHIRRRLNVLDDTANLSDARWELDALVAMPWMWDDMLELGNSIPSIKRQHLTNAIANFCFDRAEWSRAEPLFRLTLRIKEELYGPEDSSLGNTLNRLALLLVETNRLEEAESLYRRALANSEVAIKGVKSKGVNSPKEPAILSNLAMLLKRTNRLAEAESLMRRALAISEREHRADDPDIAITLNNLAVILQAANRLSEAEPLFRRALAIKEAAYGPEHRNVAMTLGNIGWLLMKTNRLAEAEPLLRRVVVIDKATFGLDHPDLASHLGMLAGLLQATNRLTEAEPLFRRALAIDEAAYGPEHPAVSRDLSNLATLLQKMDRLAEAEPLMRRVMVFDDAALGPDHPDLASHLNMLAQLLQATDRLSEAEPLMRRALTLLSQFAQANEHGHPDLSVTIGNYTDLLMEMGHTHENALSRLNEICRPYGIKLGDEL